MKINFLEISNFRNFEHASLQFGSKINLFYGQNGSGKTSLLEAIHYLGLGRSFRTRNLARIIHHTAESFSLFGQLSQSSGGTLPVGIERARNVAQATIKIGGKAVNSLIQLAELLPLQLINADSHLLLTSGPLTRRQFLDWGVFHVEPSFYHHWQRANRIIKQRNANLKNAASYGDVALWDEELQSCSIWLDTRRRKYIDQFSPLFHEMLVPLLQRDDFYLHYSPGWNNQKSLKELLNNSFARDRQLGYTQVGPHRADLQLKVKNVPAGDILSQGQQKLAAYALRLAQGRLLQAQVNKSCIYLIDDLPSELDKKKRGLVADIIASLDGQFFVTGIEPESLLALFEKDAQRFHVEHGRVG